MKKEIKFVLSTILLMAGALGAFISLSSFTSSNDVVLQGQFGTGELRSSTVDFSVTVDANSINIDYWKDYKNITIEILDATGQTVYNNVVDPVAGGSLTIDISDWTEGSYHISFTNTSGGCIYGDFDVLHF